MTEEELRAGIALHKWWHIMELAPGVFTPGEAHNRALFRHLEIEDDLSGMSVLDIGCWDGYYSFMCEQRGADRVVASDIWDYAGRGAFDFAREALGSEVEPHQASVYDLSPELGRFDLVLFLGVLYHVKDPLGALEKVAAMTAPGGVLIVDTVVDKRSLLDARPMMVLCPGSELNDDPSNWWIPNLACLNAMLRVAGFSRVVHSIGLYADDRSVVHAVKGSDEYCKKLAIQDHRARHAWTEG